MGNDFISSLENATTVISLSLLLLAILMSGAAHGYYKHIMNKRNAKRGIDKANVLFVFRFFCNLGDFITDILFCTVLFYDDNARSSGLQYFSLGFTIGPHLVSMVVCLYFIVKWNRSIDDRFSSYLKKYEIAIVFCTLIAGFYATISLVQSIEKN